MEPERAIEILSYLAKGIDPITGENLGKKSPFNNVEFVRSILFGIEALETNKSMGEDRKKANKTQKASFSLKKLTDEETLLYKGLLKWCEKNSKEEFIKRLWEKLNERKEDASLKSKENFDELLKIPNFCFEEEKQLIEEVTKILDDFTHLREGRGKKAGDQNNSGGEFAKTHIEFTKKYDLPERTGLNWSKEENKKVVELFEKGFGIKEIAEELKRTEKAVKIRLVKLGKLEDE